MAGGPNEYVHGYSEREARRLSDQAAVLRDLIHEGTRFPAGALVLEAGCGTGQQTISLAGHSPDAAIVSVDVSPNSLADARAHVRDRGLTNVTFIQADLRSLPFPAAQFDHVFVCFVLEHLPDPVGVLHLLRGLLKPGGSITAMEGDHGSCYFHPETPEARLVWNCLPEVQRHQGGDGLVGRRLYPLLAAAGFRDVVVEPRMVYADESRPREVEGFVHNTIVPMVEGVRSQSLALGLADAATWNQGIADLRATGDGPEGTFCYTFFKGLGFR